MREIPASVLFVTSDFPPDAGGLQRTTERLAFAMRDMGVKLLVVAPSAPGDAAVDTAMPFPVWRYARGSRVGSLLDMTRITRRALKQFQPERVIAMTWVPSGIAVKLARPFVSRAPVTVLTHGTEIAHQTNLPRRLLLRATVAGMDISANSRFTRGLLRDRGVTRVRVVNPGADPVQASKGERASDPTVLSVGRLVPRKGVDMLIEATARLASRFPTMRLVVVGTGPDRARLAALARERGVENRVEFTGGIDDDELARRYAEAWCFAMPNRTEGTDVEGFGLVFLEAGLHGVAAIGGRNSGAEDAIVDGVTGRLVDGRDTESVVDALADVLGDRERAERLGRAGRERAEREFTWARYAEQLLREAPDARRRLSRR